MTPAHADKIFQAIDTMDADAFVAFLTPGGTFKFGNSPPVSGRDNVHALVHGFWQSISGSSHRQLHLWNDGETVAVQGEVTYTRKDARQVTVPFVNVFNMDGEHIAEYLIHIDNTPLFAP